MAENQGRNQVTLEELTLSNMYEIQALIELLEEAGILTKAELLERIKEIRERGRQ